MPGTRKIGFRIYPRIALTIEYISFKQITEYQKIFITYSEMVYRLGYFTFRFTKCPSGQNIALLGVSVYMPVLTGNKKPVITIAVVIEHRYATGSGRPQIH